ncbi:hypothetical protein Dda_2741 [Drechslerella dactyloides]|uniref:Arrestin C-terminal-like domain-containing protein n=1 Tax=Drechslerella dactyloides TaxID=74499 RepID=A0AAD6J4F7_DREDA|nr:hypothetical protein Dda_2741 [Drechslerella dactyloides]
MVNPHRISGGLLADRTSAHPVPLSASQRSSRRRTYHGPSQPPPHLPHPTNVSSTDLDRLASSNTNLNSSSPATRASGRANSSPTNTSSLKFPRFAGRLTAKRLFQQFVSSAGFSTSQPVDVRTSPPPPPATTLIAPAAPPAPVPAPAPVPTTTNSPPRRQRERESAPPPPSRAAPRPNSSRSSRAAPTAGPAQSNDRMTPTAVAIGGGNTGIPSHQMAIYAQQQQNQAQSSPRTSSASLNTRHGRSGSVGSNVSSSCMEKPLASTSGGQMTLDIRLAEPYLFLQGYDPAHQQSVGGPALLRGTLVIKITKPAKIKTITLTFKGRARTDWPEGIPPSKTAFSEEKEIMTHTWPFFNAQFAVAEVTYGADSTRLLPPEPDTRLSRPLSGAPGAIGSLARTSSPIGISAASSTLASDKRLSLQLNQSKTFNRSESPGRSVASRGYKLFQPGEYTYNFELPIENILPETIQCELGSVKYELEAVIERAGAFRPNLVGKKDVVLIRCPADTSLEQVEPIAISRNWEDQLHYDIVISGKSFPMGSQIPIAFKLTPLAKVRCHRIKIYVTENIEYFCRNKKVHRIEPTRKIQIFEKRADGPISSPYPGSSARVLSGGRRGDPDNPESSLSPDQRLGDNLLGDLEGDIIGPTEMEFNVRLPGCGAKEGKIHFDTTYKNIQVHHWIKIVMRLSKLDPNDPNKRRHFEISIDSPFHILSCKCSHANISLPAYTDRDHSQQLTNSCNCPNSGQNSPLPFGNVVEIPALPDTAPNDLPRPMHLLRAPSFNPPAFDDDIAPPPLATPPPHYDTVGGGLADYFARLADQTAEDEDTEDESPGSRLAVAPSTRLARSLDERRTWVSAT